MDNEAKMETAEPDMGPLFNRLADNWRPLYAIAHLAGDNWPDLARKAADALIVIDDDTETIGIKLLADIRAVFTEAGKNVVLDEKDGASISSHALTEILGAMEGRPWAEFGRTNKPITVNRLARLLKPFAILPGKIGPETARVSGYRLCRFMEVFGRHLPPL
jgi:hypothetical protein